MSRAAILTACVILAGCNEVERNYACINGTLHAEWSPGVWVQLDGRNYIGRQDGPIPCVAQKEAK